MRVTFKKNKSGEFVWTVQAANWEIIGSSSESYHNRRDCVSNFEQLTGRRVKDRSWKKEEKVYAVGGKQDWDVRFEW